jgi:hypothetical protein
VALGLDSARARRGICQTANSSRCRGTLRLIAKPCSARARELRRLLSSQKVFGKPACCKTLLAVWRLTIPTGTGNRRPVIGLNQI